VATSGQFRLWRDEAAAAAARGDKVRALTLYEHLATAEPNEPRWLLKIAELHRAVGHLPEAVEAYRGAAEALAKTGFELKAVAACKVALELRPDDVASKRLLETLLPTTSAERPSRPPGTVADSAPDSAGRKGSNPGTRTKRTTLDEIEVAKQLPGTTRDAGDGIVEIEFGWSDVDATNVGYQDMPVADAATSTEVSTVRTKPDADSTGELDASSELFGARPAARRAKTRPPIDPARVRGLPLIGPLPAEALETFLARTELRTASPGDRVITEGTPADSVYLVVRGDLVATRGTPPRALARLGENSFFGEMALLDDTPRSASVTAVTDVELLVLPRELIVEICDAYPGVLTALLHSLRARLVATLTSTSPLFAPIAKDERAKIVARFRFRDIEPGTTFIRQGQRADGLSVLLTGRADVLVDGIPVASLTTGDIVGEMSCLAAGPALASVRARSRVSTLSIPVAELQELTMVHPQVLEHLATLSAARQDELQELRAARDAGGRSVRRV